MGSGRRAWLAIGLAAWSCLSAAVSARGQTLGPEARRFASCERVADASSLDDLHRAGIGAVICAIAPNLRFAILSDDTVSWPQIKDGSGPWVSLEDPVAAKVWFPNTSPLRVRFDQDSFVIVRNAESEPLAVVYSATASRTDVAGNIEARVIVRVRSPCLLGVTLDHAAALRTAQDRNSSCISPVSRR